MKQKFCINSVSSFQQINSSLNNKSQTKQTFSFSKTPRFDVVKPVCKNSTYGGDFIQHKIQGTGIGYGGRSDFTKCLTVSPSATKYQLVTQFQQNKQRRRGSTIGFSRQKIAFNQYIDKEQFKVPGSTKYEFEKKTQIGGPSFSMRPKTKILERSMTLDPQKQNPGPGTYSHPQAPRVSKYSQITYGTSKGQRFSSHDNKVPGAGKYKDQLKLSAVGQYQNSKYKGGTQARFSKSGRNCYFDQSARTENYKPGPGNYRTPSEFGQYDGDVYVRPQISRFQRKN